MQLGEEMNADDVLREITNLLAAAYRQRARIRLVRPPAESSPSTEELDKTAEPSANELTLTRRRKESQRS